MATEITFPVHVKFRDWDWNKDWELTLPGWDASSNIGSAPPLSRHQNFIRFPRQSVVTNFYFWVERVACLKDLAGLGHGSLHLESCAPTIRPPLPFLGAGSEANGHKFSSLGFSRVTFDALIPASISAYKASPPPIWPISIQQSNPASSSLFLNTFTVSWRPHWYEINTAGRTAISEGLSMSSTIRKNKFTLRELLRKIRVYIPAVDFLKIKCWRILRKELHYFVCSCFQPTSACEII